MQHRPMLRLHVTCARGASQWLTGCITICEEWEGADALPLGQGLFAPNSALRATHTTQPASGLRWRRGAKPQAVRAYDKAKQRHIHGGVRGSKGWPVQRRTSRAVLARMVAWPVSPSTGARAPCAARHIPKVWPGLQTPLLCENLREKTTPILF